MAKKPALRVDIGRFFQPDEATSDIDFLMKVPDEEIEQVAREHGMPLMHLPLAVIAPDPSQLRRLPHPDDLVCMAEEGDKAALRLLATLRDLGHSIVEHGQLQPAIVYPDSDPENPAITHRLLHGQRRWSAARLEGVTTLWVVEVSRPTQVQRILRQFDENERRESLADIERAWAMVALKAALQEQSGSDVPWGAVEEYLHLSTPRRKDLLRLLRFSEEGQTIILRYGWPEWTLRPLHMAISAGTIPQDAATSILHHLAQEPDVNATVVTRLVKSYLAQASSVDVDPPAEAEELPTPQEIARRSSITARHMVGVRQNIDTLRSHLSLITDDRVRHGLRQEAEQLHQSITALLEEF